MKALRLLILIAGLACTSAHAASGMVTEVITIGYRSVDEMVSLLKPMVPKPGSVSGAYGKIVVRTTPENMREIKEILATMDRAPANLMISVRHTINEEVRRDLAQARGVVQSENVSVTVGKEPKENRGLTVGAQGSDAEVSGHVVATQRLSDDYDPQRVRALEGKEAFIQTGQAVPVAERGWVVSDHGVLTHRDSIRYKNVNKGFYARARLNTDNRVTVEIFPHRNSLSPGGGGVIDTREASTIVSGELGRWMEIGGVSDTSNRSTRGIASSTDSRSIGEYAIYMKVDRLDR